MSHPGLCLAILAVCAAAVGAEPEGVKHRPEVYTTASFAGRALNGDFTGTRVVSSVKGYFAIPAVDEGTGFDLAVGIRNERIGIEAHYGSTSHAVSLQEGTGTSRRNGLGVDGLLFAPAFRSARFFLSAGISLERLSIDGAYCSDSTGAYCTARFEGLGFSVGPGAVLPVGDRFFLTSRLVYSRTEFDTIESVEAGEGTLPYAVPADGWYWLTGIGIRF